MECWSVCKFDSQFDKEMSCTQTEVTYREEGDQLHNCEVYHVCQHAYLSEE